MKYVTLDRDWIKDQLKKNGSLGTSTGDLILEFLYTIENGYYEISDLDRLDDILERVGKLAKGHPIAVDETENWTDAIGGEINVRDIVRVKPDAYTARTGLDNNGKRGRVTVLRNGRATVFYDGESLETAKSHTLDKLQKLEVE